MLNRTPVARWTSPLLTLPLLVAAAPAMLAQAPNKVAPSALEQSVDPEIRPGDDFFAYANGAWLRATPMPAANDRWGARNEINQRTRVQLVQLLDDARTEPPGSLARKVADFRAAYQDEAGIESRGIAPLQPLLDSISRIRDKADLTRFLGRWLIADVDPLNWGVYRSSRLLGLAVEEGNNGEREYQPYLLQGGLGLPDRDDYLGPDTASRARRSRYLDHLSHVLTVAGVPDAGHRAESVLSLETALALTQATGAASANDHNADSLWTRADFARRAPGMDWSLYFEAAGLSRQQRFVAWQPGALVGVAALVRSQPLPAWQDYLRFHALNDYAEVLPGAVRESSAATPRADLALDRTSTLLGEAVGRLYAERYFSPRSRARVQAIVGNVTAAFRHRVQSATWLSPSTRATALAKLETLYVGVGYPDRWQDYSDLVVDRADAVGNVRRVSDRNYRRALARLGQPVDPTEWLMNPQVAGAILTFQLTAYDFTSALLQAPKYDSTASDAATYGAIGSIIGHDVTHFVDLLGADYEAGGRNHRWWTAADLAGYQSATAPLVAQFSGYQPFPDLAVNGKLTLTENLADLGGLVAAFDAYRAALGERAADSASVRKSDREFFLAFAQAWRTRIGAGAFRAQVESNDHAPEMFRVSTVRNLDAWYDAFDVRPTDRLYLAPSARVRVW